MEPNINRRIITLVVLTLMALMGAGMLACGPADESVQREIGNLPPVQDAEPTNTPEPTPVPTVCIQFEKPDGSVGDICITPSPPSTPTKYGQNLKEKLLEAEQQSGGAGRTTRSSDEEPWRIYVTVHMNHDITNSPAVVANFLKENDIDPGPDAESKAFFKLYLTASLIRKLLEMDEVEGVTPVGRPFTGERLPECVLNDQGRCQ